MRRLLASVVCVCALALAQAADYDQYYQGLPCQVKAVTPFSIPQNTVSIADCGAVADGQTLCTEAIEKAISRLTKQGGGRVLVPEGVWLTGPIMLKDNIELHLAQGALLCFAPDKRLYLDKNPKAKRVYPCIRASKRKNIAITGHGVIDGGGQQWRPVKRSKMSDVEWQKYQQMGGETTADGQLWYPWKMKSGYPDIAPTAPEQEGMRNDLVRFTDCENVLVEGVTIQNSPRFHLHPCYCRNVIIDGVNVQSEWNVQNGDGIDLSDCHQVIVVNSRVSVGDDGICLKSGLPDEGRIAGCEDILVVHNVVNHAHGGFVLGSETAGGMRRIVACHNVFSGTDVGLRFKSAPGRGGKTEQLYVYDIQMNDIADEAIAFQCDYVNRHAGRENDEPQFTEEQLRWAPMFQDIHISRVVCHGAKTAIKAAGIQGMKSVHGITLSDCTIVYDMVEKDIDAQTTQLTLNNVHLVKNQAAN